MNYIYLHGCCSGPESIKARFFQQRFAEHNVQLVIPDFNVPNFQTLTLTRQIQQVKNHIQQWPETTIIGASLGAMTALFLAEQCHHIKRLVLLAPAINFYQHALRLLGKERSELWQKQGVIPVPHNTYQADLPLNYSFLQDLAIYQENELQRPIPGLVFHGIDDEAIDYADVKSFCEKRPYLQFHPQDSDHGLLNVMESIWSNVQDFIELDKATVTLQEREKRHTAKVESSQTVSIPGHQRKTKEKTRHPVVSSL